MGSGGGSSEMNVVDDPPFCISTSLCLQPCSLYWNNPVGEPDRVRFGVYRSRQASEGERVGRDDLAPVGGDGGQLHRRPRGGPVHRANQDWGALPVRASGQVQPG